MTDHMPAAATPTPHAKCGAKLKTRPGDLCPRPPLRGQTRCRMHGGAAPQAKAAASKRLAEQRMTEAVKTFGLRREISPEDALLEEIEWTAGHVQWLRLRVQDLDADALGLDAGAAAPVMQRLFAEMLRSLAGGPLAVSS